MKNDTVNKGRILFVAIVVITIFLQLAPSFPAMGSSMELIISRLIFPISVIALYLYLAYSTYKGYKWARVALAVSYLASVISSLPTVLYLLSSKRSTNFVMLAFEIKKPDCILRIKSKQPVARKRATTRRSSHQRICYKTKKPCSAEKSTVSPGYFRCWGIHPFHPIYLETALCWRDCPWCLLAILLP